MDELLVAGEVKAVHAQLAGGGGVLREVIREDAGLRRRAHGTGGVEEDLRVRLGDAQITGADAGIEKRGETAPRRIATVFLAQAIVQTWNRIRDDSGAVAGVMQLPDEIDHVPVQGPLGVLPGLHQRLGLPAGALYGSRPDRLDPLVVSALADVQLQVAALAIEAVPEGLLLEAKRGLDSPVVDAVGVLEQHAAEIEEYGPDWVSHRRASLLDKIRDAAEMRIMCDEIHLVGDSGCCDPEVVARRRMPDRQC